MEKYIKRQKSRNLLEKLIDPEFIPTGTLAQLVRVPHLRD
jgi:putative endonuclease